MSRVSLNGKVLSVKIDDDIFDSWWAPTVSAKEIRNGVDMHAGEFDSVDVVVTSLGGDVTQGMAIRSIFQNLVNKGIAVNIEVAGVAASISSIIALSGSSLKMRVGSYLMIHNPFSITMGDAQEHRNKADTLDTMEADLATIYSNSSNLSSGGALELMSKETWISAEKAVEYGFAVEAVDVEEGTVLNYSGATQTSMSMMFNSFHNVPTNILNSVEKPNEPVPSEPTNRGAAMKLDDLLASDPEAKAEFEARIAGAGVKASGGDEPTGTTGEDKPVDTGDAKAFAKTIMNSDKYGKSTKTLAVDVLAGDADVSALKSAVAAADAVIENNASLLAQIETLKGGETPQNKKEGDEPEGGNGGSGIVNSQADVDKLLETIHGAGN